MTRFTALFPGPPGWASARRELLDFMVQGRLTEADTVTIRLGATPSRLTSAHLHHPPHIFYRPNALPAAQPTVSKRWRLNDFLNFYVFKICFAVSVVCDNGVRIVDVAVLRYTAACSKLLVQIKAAFKQLNDDDYPSVEEFVRKCKVITRSCQSAIPHWTACLAVLFGFDNCGCDIVY